jgi:hypothetical protein
MLFWLIPLALRICWQKYDLLADINHGGNFFTVFAAIVGRYAASCLVHIYPFTSQRSFFQVLVVDRCLINVGCLSLVVLRRGWLDQVSLIGILTFWIVVVIELMRFSFREDIRLQPNSSGRDTMKEWSKKPEEKVRLVLTATHLVFGIYDLCARTHDHSSWCFVCSALHAVGFATYPRNGAEDARARPWHVPRVWGQHEDFHTLCTAGDLALFASLYCAL